jgi:acyl-coenzyme A thioesterase PaaI-like protein
MAGVEREVIDRWNRAKGTALGRWLFSRGVGRFAPYTGTIGARVLELESGLSVVSMRDRKAVRNHLNSIHAVALTNLIELSGSLSIIGAMHPGTRMIPVRLESEFLKKARGEVTAKATCEPPAAGFEGEIQATVVVRDSGGDEVTRGRVTVVIGKAG